MREGDFRIRGREISRAEGIGARVKLLHLAAGIAALGYATACSKAPPPRALETAATNRGEPVAATAGGLSCPATGQWAQCSVLHSLDRAGLAPHLDSAATPEEKALSGSAFVVKIGSTARLEVFLYPDSAARLADEKKLDKSKLVGATAPQTIQRERTLIENANLVGLLTSINDHQRERVSDALTAGPPQPSSR